MKRPFAIILVLTIFELATLLCIYPASAGDSLSLAISCTIPAIPGVNSPLIEIETSQTETDAARQTEYTPTRETLRETPLIIE